jgi:O-antigen biosynthesis protein
MFFFFLKRLALILLAALVFPLGLALAFFFFLFDLAIALFYPASRHVRDSEDRVLLIQSAEPAAVLNVLKHLKSLPHFRDSRYTVFCRNRSEILKHFAGHPMLSRVLTHSETAGWWNHILHLRRERFDAVVVLFTGNPSYWKIKCFAFLLGGRHKLIFDENNHVTALSFRSWFALFERDLLFSGIFQSMFWKMHSSLRRVGDHCRLFRSRKAVIPARPHIAETNLPIEEKQAKPPSAATAADLLSLEANTQHGLNTARELIASLAKIALDNLLSSSARLQLPNCSEPEVSVILVLYNRAELTLQCLRSLIDNGHESLEIIIIDNASMDATPSLLNRIDGAIILRNQENIHFLRGANLGAQQAHGRYLLFLNNDTQVLPGAIQAAIRTIENSQSIGAVGGRLILPDGRLQEAGSIVWRDGSCLGYGRGADPLSPEFRFRRDVDYCSGAFLLTRRETFTDMGGFDEAFQPFYYEETDFCIRLWKRGFRVVYEPDAAVLHYEFASSSSSKEAQEWHARHQGLFLQRHRDYLKDHYDCDEENILKARSAGNHRPMVLFIDDRVPHPALGSGFPRSNAILSGLAKLGSLVTFYPTEEIEEDWHEVYSDIPREVEVMLNHGSRGLHRFLASRVGHYDLIFVSRPNNMQYLRPIVKAHPDWFRNTRIIYDAEALFAFRDLTAQRMKGGSLTDEKSEQLIRSEIELVDVADLVVSVSNFEANTFARYGIQNTRVLGHSLAVSPTPRAFNDRRGILFVGAILEENSPNGDAVFWFLREILPIIRSELGNVPFSVAGVNKVDFGSAAANSQLKLLGKVADLTPAYDEARIFIAPTRYAAGVPHKIHEASARGIPVVATSLLAQQLGWSNDAQLLVGDTPQEFAEQCIQLYRDVRLWERIRQNALDQVRQECSPITFQNTIESIIQRSDRQQA